MIPVAKIDNLLRLDIQNGNFFVTLHINLIQILMQMPDLSTYFPVTDPTWIFFLVLSIILFAPILLGKLKIPHIVGMILAGVLIGPYGLHVLDKDSSFELFGNVGLYYIMSGDGYAAHEADSLAGVDVGVGGICFSPDDGRRQQCVPLEIQSGDFRSAGQYVCLAHLDSLSYRDSIRGVA